MQKRTRNRWIWMVTCLVLLLIPFTAFAGHGEKGFADCTIDLIDVTGNSAWDAIDEEFWDVTGHRMQAKLIAPQDGFTGTIAWKSTNKKVATIDKQGVITCKKEGFTRIIATCKGEKVQKEVKLHVLRNEANYAFDYNEIDLLQEYCHVTAKRIYFKKNTLWVDFWVYNNTANKLRTPYPQEIYFSMDYEQQPYLPMGVFGNARLKKVIKPGKLGVMTLSLGEHDPSTLYLLWADAVARGQIYGGWSPKAHQPSRLSTEHIRPHHRK